MKLLLSHPERYPTLVRVAPFAVFLLLTGFQDSFGEGSRYWIYLGKMLLGGLMLWAVKPLVSELRLAFSWQAFAVGVGVFIVWVGLDPLFIQLGLPASYPRLSVRAEPWNPQAYFSDSPGLAACILALRIGCMCLVVPPLEEVFFRSWLYRTIVRSDFQAVPLGQFLVVPFLLSSLIFGLEHVQWLAGILAGLAYQGLVCWKKRLGDAIVAHAVTNGLLGVWVVWQRQWQFF